MFTPALHLSEPLCPNGLWWAHGSHFFTTPNKDPLKSADLQTTFRKFKLVEIDIRDTGTTVKWDLEHASVATLETTLDRIRTFQRPITLVFFKRAWAIERYPDWEPAAARILQLNEVQRLSSFVDPDVASIERLDPRDLDGMVPLVRRAAETLDPGLVSQQVFFRYDARANDFILHEIGPTSGLLNVMGRRWAQNAIGTTAAPTKEDGFDDAVTPPYWEVLESGEAVFDMVSAMMQPPGQEPLWFKYQRLIQPWVENGKRIGCVVTTMRVDQEMPSALIVSAK